MPWVRFDDQFPIHRKVDGLSDAAYRLHTSAIFWCARNLTDGFVSEEDLDGVTARVRTPARFASECVKRGVWHEARHDCGSQKCPGPLDEDGWIIHDYLEYQFSREQVIHDRKKAAERQANWRAAKAGKPRYPQDKPRDAPRTGQDNASSNGVSHAVSSSSPPRPEISGAAGRPGAAGRRASPTGPPSGARPSDQSVAEALDTGHARARPLPPEEVAARAAAIRQSFEARRRPP